MNKTGNKTGSECPIGFSMDSRVRERLLPRRAQVRSQRANKMVHEYMSGGRRAPQYMCPCIWPLADSQKQIKLYTFSVYAEWPHRDSMAIYIFLFAESILGYSPIAITPGKLRQREVLGAVLKLVRLEELGVWINSKFSMFS